ncbi:hypothetical protein H8D57_02375 [bacterium]|nr:hypothetical protein [bacterium]
MATSFLSEHSVEFCLTHRLSQLLSPAYNVTPLYFWRSREGSRIAKECDNGESIRVVAVYARRPKLLSPGDGTVVMKVNEQVILRANYLIEQGIPVFCGVPIIFQILDFSVDSHCAWFQLMSDEVHEDLEVLIDVKTGALRNDSIANSLIPTKEKQITKIIKESARGMTLSAAIESIRGGWVSDFDVNRRSFWIEGNYKPFYLFLKDV